MTTKEVNCFFKEALVLEGLNVEPTEIFCTVPFVTAIINEHLWI